MKKKSFHPFVGGTFILVALITLGGCSKSQSPVGPVVCPDDQTSLRAFVEDNPDLFIYDSDDGSLGSGETGQAVDLVKAIDPVAFWREITSHEKDIDIHIVHPGGDSLPYADVTITTYVQGLFHTVTMDSDYTKEIDDRAVRYAYFERREVGQNPRGLNGYGGWELKKISPWEVRSNPCTKEIHSVRIVSNSGLVETTITDASSLWNLADLLVFQPGDSVTLTVDTGDPDDLVFLHAPLCLRRPFRHVGAGVFVGTWVIAEDPQQNAVRRHAAIDVIDHGTVFDDPMPYDSRAWGMIYLVGENLLEN